MLIIYIKIDIIHDYSRIINMVFDEVIEACKKRMEYRNDHFVHFSTVIPSEGHWLKVADS